MEGLRNLLNGSLTLSLLGTTGEVLLTPEFAESRDLQVTEQRQATGPSETRINDELVLG